MTKAKLTRIPKRVLACVLAVLMVLSCLTMLPFTGFAAPTHVKLESPAVVQDDDTYYAFGSGNKYYTSSDMANWDTREKSYVDEDGLAEITDLFGSAVEDEDLKSPEVISYDDGETWKLYLSLMDGSRSMIIVGTSENIGGTYSGFQKVLETGFSRSSATDVLQFYFKQGYGNNYDSAAPAEVKGWGKGTCYYYSNFLGLNYQWFTEELPRAYAPSITQAPDGNYYMAYGYRNGGIWLQKIDTSTGLIDFSWSGNNWSAAGGRNGDYHYTLDESYDSSNVEKQRLDPYFGQLIAHTTEGGDTDTLESSVSRAGEEPELYTYGGKLYLQVTYGGPDNGDGYNVRSYVNDHNISANGVTIFNFEDMNGESGVDNANESMIAAANNRTGLKLMGDYGLPGTTNGETYYTSPGASSVSTGENGMLFYNYQVKTNNSKDASPAETTAELRSHILLHNVNGDPLVTPFEYAGDAAEYNSAKTTRYQESDIVGQYYVTSFSPETSTSKETYGGITLTADGAAMGLISGTWEFVNSDQYANYIVIRDASGNEYQGALLRQDVEQPGTLNNLEQTMTFTLVGNNQTVWGAWYDNYTPSGENNAADSALSVSPAIYTGGALSLNANYNGQLGLKWGNYITALKFANLDYSSYLTIDDQYEITDVRDDEDSDENDNIGFMEVTSANIENIVSTMYTNRDVDGNEAEISDENGAAGRNTESANELRNAMQDKINEMANSGQRVYILTGWLDNARFGRNAENGQQNDKGDVVLTVEYENAQGNTYSERVYSHVYQQPVPANLSGASYSDGTWSWDHDYVNTAFLRAEGSYSDDSYLDGAIRNRTIRNDITKRFAASPTFSYYNDTLYTSSPDYGSDGEETFAYFHGNTTPIITNDYHFNEDYRNSGVGADITVSYESTFNDKNGTGENFDTEYDFALNAGPRAEYYIDLSSAETSNIAGYYNADAKQYSIPLYYSTISVTHDRFLKVGTSFTFNYYNNTNDSTYTAGLFPADEYGLSSAYPLGRRNTPVYNSANSSYAFKADFSQVEHMYDGTGNDLDDMNDGGVGDGYYRDGLKWANRSYSANILISAAQDAIHNNVSQSYGQENTDDYNFYVRTKSESKDNINGDEGHIRLVSDMEYGIYVSNKTYLRDYYDIVMADKVAQNYTYYSWEEFRDATRLIADYLNNYMELADQYSDPDGTGAYTHADYELQVSDGTFPAAVNRYGGLNTVLTDRDQFARLLSEYGTHVQDLLCYLLTAAEEQLFSYNTYQNFMDAYDQYNLAWNQMNNYTASSWKEYLGYQNISLGEDVAITIADLANYTPDSNDSEVDPVTEIYNPSDPQTTAGLNTSWKIIYDNFFGEEGARAFFERATDLLNEATNVLRNKADYSDLDAQMEKAGSYVGNATLGSNNQPGEAAANGIESTEQQNAGIFSIDRSTVAALANSMNQGTEYVTGNADEEGKATQYTISAMAAFDKIYNSVWELDEDITSDQQYADLVTKDGVLFTDRSTENGSTDPNAWYSDAVRDDQQRYENVSETSTDGQNTNALSTVQEKINDKAGIVETAVNWLMANQTDTDSAYQTFDYLIDVISTIDFNAYTPEGQTKLWNTLYDMLVKGGVYAVNQQFFAAPSSESGTEPVVPTDSPLYDVLYGDVDSTYYTGWNTTDVDAATTELMELLTELDETERKSYNVTFTVQYMDPDGTEADSHSIDIEKEYNNSLPLSISDIPGASAYDPATMYAYSWVVKVTSDDNSETLSTANLRQVGGQYTYTSNNNANITVYVTRGMPDPFYNGQNTSVPVTVSTRFNQRNELAMNLPSDELSKYNVSVNGSTLTVTNEVGVTLATVTAAEMPYFTFNGWLVGRETLEEGQPYTLADFYNAETGSGINITTSYTLNGFEQVVTVNGMPYTGEAAADGGTVKHDAYISINPDNYPEPDMPGEFYAWLVATNDANEMNERNGADKDWKIAAYTKTYSYNVPNGGQQFVQVNWDETSHTYFVYQPGSDDSEATYVTYTSESQYDVVSDNMKELNTDSLYYRLNNHLRDSWSSMSAFDSTSRKVSLFSHFTAAEDVEGAATVVENGCVAMYVDKLQDLPSEAALEEQLQIDKPNVNQFVSSASTSTTSEGQYMMSISFPETMVDDNWAVAMRSYVTYSYYGWNEEQQKYGQIYRTVYSDVKLADLVSE